MIGQENLLKTFNTLIDNDSLPHCMILVGAKGSGKKTFIDEAFKMNKYKLQDVKIDSIRAMIQNVYKSHNMLYVIADADGMSVNAKNSILKVIEECPNNNYFIITLEDENNTLPTIRSRATIYKMDNYTKDDILNYAKEKVEMAKLADSRIRQIICDLCDNPGEVNTLNAMGIQLFYSYVEKVIESIARVSGANAFKIADKIAFKDEEDKYDLKLFWKCFMRVCMNRIKGFNNNEGIQAIQITSEALKELRIKSLNKNMLFDRWILEIRKVWL